MHCANDTKIVHSRDVQCTSDESPLVNLFYIESWPCNKASPKLCTLFPDRVLPVKSSLMINNENSFGRFGMFHGWIGVFSCASYKTAVIP